MANVDEILANIESRMKKSDPVDVMVKEDIGSAPTSKDRSDEVLAVIEQRLNNKKSTSKEEPVPTKSDNSQIEPQNIIGATFNVPGATSRAAILSNPALAITGPLAGLLATQGVGGEKAQQAATEGALNPSSVQTFQDQAIQAGQRFGGESQSVAVNFLKGLIPSAAGLAADMVTDPTNVLTSLLIGLKPSKIKPISEVVDKQFIKAVNPGTRGVKKYSDITKLENNARAAVESIVDNKQNLQFTDEAGVVTQGQLPENLEQFSQAISQTKKTIFNQYDTLLKNAGEQGAKVPLKPISEEIVKAVSNPQIEDLSPTVQKYGMELAQRLEKRGTYTLTEAQDAIEALNNKLKSYFSNPTPEALHQAVIDRAVVNQLREHLVKTVESKTGEGYDILRRQYGKLNSVEEAVTKSAVRNAGQVSSGLGRMFDALSSGDIVSGILTLNPASVAKGTIQVGIRRIYAGLNNPNKIVKKMFSEVNRIKNIEPAKATLRSVLKKAALAGAVSAGTNLRPQQ